MQHQGLAPQYLIVGTGPAVHGDPGRWHRARRQGQERETTQKQHQEMLQLWQGGVQGEHPKSHVPKTRSEAEHSKDLAPSRARLGSRSTTSPPFKVGHNLQPKKNPEPQCPKESSPRADSSGHGCPWIIYWEPGDTRQNSPGSPPAPSFVPKANSTGTPG